MLPEGPDGHLVGPGQSEEPGGEALGHESEGDPGPDLVGVVGAGDQIEQEGEGVPVRSGDLPDLAAGGSEVPQQDVDGEVAELTGGEGRQTGVDLELTGASVERMVDVVRNICCKPPVVATVLGLTFLENV